MIINSPLDVMASASTQQSSNESTISSSKSFIEKTVCLEDWWLEKPENNSKGSPLAIAGTTPKGHTFLEHTISSHRRKPVRWFSAPIWKRHDVTTLETVDGVFVIIQGFMNKARTTANGFSSEICKYFVYGFPSDWEKYAKKCYGGECPLSSVSIRSQDLEPLSPLPMDGDNAIENAEAIPAYKSRSRLVLKQILNDDDMKTITPPVRHTRRSLSSAKQKRKQKEKPEYKSAYVTLLSRQLSKGSSTSRKRKDKSSAVSHVTSSVKRSRSVGANIFLDGMDDHFLCCLAKAMTYQQFSNTQISAVYLTYFYYIWARVPPFISNFILLSLLLDVPHLNNHSDGPIMEPNEQPNLN